MCASIELRWGSNKCWVDADARFQSSKHGKERDELRVVWHACSEMKGDFQRRIIERDKMLPNIRTG